MSQELQAPESGAGSAPADPAAVSLSFNGASRDKADAFLDDQRAMLHLQMEELRERNPYEISHLHWQRFTDRMRAALQVMTVIVGLAVFGALCVMVWKAAHAEGLIVESFAAPPALAEKGFSGQAIASRMLDKLTGIQRDSSSVLPSRSYANNWGDNLKVEIPETGISIAEVYRFLRGWLGHETRVSGEVTRTEDGIAVTARVDGADAATFTGPEAELDALLLQSAQHVYRVTQPDRYARYLYVNADRGGPARYDEARSILTDLLANGTVAEKASAFHGLGVLEGFLGNIDASIADYRQTLALNPDSSITYSNLAAAEYTAGHAEAALVMAQACVRMMDRRPVPNLNPDAVPRTRSGCQIRIAMLSGDFAAVPGLAQSWLNTVGAQSPEATWGSAVNALAQQHDAAAAGSYLDRLPAPTTAGNAATRAITRLQLLAGRKDWDAIATQAQAAVAANFRARDFASIPVVTVMRPWLAYARAMTGDFAAAHALIDRTPADCDLCLRMRGNIRAAEKNYAGADYWFARAVADAPSIPMAHEDWGRSLLARGQSDAAIAQFTLSNRKGPHFADALEGWGEALMAKSQSHLALAKFAAAAKLAPNWGRLQLKWGEALTYAGKPAEAKAHFARAATLNLAPSEKAELAQMSGNVPHD